MTFLTSTTTSRPRVSAYEIERATEHASLADQAEAHLPTWADLHREFAPMIAWGEGDFVVVTDPETGKKNATLTDWTPDQVWIQRFREMTEGHRRISYDIGQNSIERMLNRRDRLKNRLTGEMEEIPEGYEGESFKRKWTTKGRTFGFGATSTAPLERSGHHTVTVDPGKVYLLDQWRFDCPLCGYRTDRWEESGDADNCSRCADSFDRYRRGAA